MSDFPRMIFKNHGLEEIHGGFFNTFIVENEEELQNALADGWFLTTCEARKPAELVPVFVDAPPTRTELERKATELGIAFDGRTTDAKLGAKIADAIKE